MEIEQSVKEKQELEARHRVERDGRIADRIKAVLLRSEGWEQRQIAKALRLHEETVGQASRRLSGGQDQAREWRVAEQAKRAANRRTA